MKEDRDERKRAKKQISLIFFFTALTVITSGFLFIVSPFFIAIILAILFAHLFMPLKRLFHKRGFKNRASSLLTFFIALVVLIAPLTLIIFLVTQEIQAALSSFTALANAQQSSFQVVQEKFDANKFIEFIENLPGVTEVMKIFSLDSQSLFAELVNYAKQLAQLLLVGLRDVIANIPAQIIVLFIMTYLTYYLILEGDTFFNSVKTFIPLEEDEKNEVVNESIRIIDATLLSTFIVGIAEGIIGGLLIYFVGINGAVIWGVLIAIMAMIPILGGNGVLVPMILYLFLTGAYVQGSIVLIFGTGSILFIEYFLKPKLMGDRSGIHPAFLLVGIIGGIYIMGLIGFILGPFIVALFFVFWKQFREKLRPH